MKWKDVKDKSDVFVLRRIYGKNLSENDPSLKCTVNYSRLRDFEDDLIGDIGEELRFNKLNCTLSNVNLFMNMNPEEEINEEVFFIRFLPQEIPLTVSTSCQSKLLTECLNDKSNEWLWEMSFKGCDGVDDLDITTRYYYASEEEILEKHPIIKGLTYTCKRIEESVRVRKLKIDNRWDSFNSNDDFVLNRSLYKFHNTITPDDVFTEDQLGECHYEAYESGMVFKLDKDQEYVKSICGEVIDIKLDEDVYEYFDKPEKKIKSDFGFNNHCMQGSTK